MKNIYIKCFEPFRTCIQNSKYIINMGIWITAFVLLTAQTPYKDEFFPNHLIITEEEQKLDQLTEQLDVIDRGDTPEKAEIQAFIEAKKAELEELKAIEPQIKEVHKIFKKVKFTMRSFKEECNYFQGCENIIKYTITNNSEYSITNIEWLFTITHKGKIIYQNSFYPENDILLLPGAKDTRRSGFSNAETSEMVIPKGAKKTAKLVELKINGEWIQDHYDEYQDTVKSIKKAITTAEKNLKSLEKQQLKQRKEILNQIAKIQKNQEAKP